MGFVSKHISIVVISSLLSLTFDNYTKKTPRYFKDLESSSDHIIRSSRCWCSPSVLNFFIKFTGKHLCQSHVFSKVAGWKTYQSLQDYTWAGVFFLIKFQAEKNCKISKKCPWRRLTFNKVAGWRYNINITLLIHLHLFAVPLITSLGVCSFTHNWKIWELPPLDWFYWFKKVYFS